MTGVARLTANGRRRTFSTERSLRAALRGGNATWLDRNPRRREIMCDTTETERARRAGLGSVQ